MENAFFAAPERAFGFAFSGAPLDRASEIREDAAAIRGLRERGDARFALIGRDMPILTRGELRAFLFPLKTLDDLGGAKSEALLGLQSDGAAVFAARLPDDAIEQRADLSDGFLDRRELVIPDHADLELVDLRSIAAQGLIAPMSVATLGSPSWATKTQATRRPARRASSSRFGPSMPAMPCAFSGRGGPARGEDLSSEHSVYSVQCGEASWGEPLFASAILDCLAAVVSRPAKRLGSPANLRRGRML